MDSFTIAKNVADRIEVALDRKGEHDRVER